MADSDIATEHVAKNTEILIGTTSTTTEENSVIKLQVEDLVCSISTQTNQFGDQLPIIPTTSRAVNNKILYRLPLNVKLIQRIDGSPAAEHTLKIKSNRPNDQIITSGTTDAKGQMSLVIETRLDGEFELTTETKNVTLPAFKIKLKEAWYESSFLITGYNVCLESDFSGNLVPGYGLAEMHKQDFLFGARGIPMQGTGQSTDGRYIRLQSMSGGWHRNSKGSPDYVNTPDSLTFSYADGVHGAFGTVSENHSIAVDPRVIPKHACVYIEGVGNRFADDRGSAIQNYHIDNFLGSGQTVVTTWKNGKINGTQRIVKYCG
ncbi:3D domain-containing protein [Quatrionicoccus australiensis]|uniref:3D domain-containing protein n=1 Tax=Quatrionicoccus australiensis TaxID=138118 RepID=UPI001CF9C862|nr:3D domain-containing protein [Quatrionicoccus australiensis]MCB4359478.1 hypothetical protein [Quatrionicoccus australiensis]